MADRFSLDEIKDLFRDDVLRFIDGMLEELRHLDAQPDKTQSLERLAAWGHSLKGTAGLVGLDDLSQAGAMVDRLSQAARAILPADTAAARSMFKQLERAVPHLRDLLTESLSGDDPQVRRSLYDAFIRQLPADLQGGDGTAGETDTLTPITTSPEDEDAWQAELAATFQEELRENLEQATTLLRLAPVPARQHESYQDLSRIFHTIKGSAAMVGQDQFAEQARILQNIFESATHGNAIPETALAEGTAALRILCDGAGLSTPSFPATADVPSELDSELIDAFRMDAQESLEASEALLLTLENRKTADPESLRALFRHFHTLKGAAAAVGMGDIADQVHHGESLLDSILTEGLAIPVDALSDFLLRLIDSVTALMNRALGIEDKQHTLLDDVGTLVAGLKKLAATTAPATAADRPGITVPEEAAPTTASEAEGIVRIPAGRLDALMNQVTQLVVSRTRMDHKIEDFGDLRDKLDYCRRRLTSLIQGFQEHYEYNIADGSAQRGTPAPAEADGEKVFTDLEFDKYDDINILARSVIELATDTGEIADQLGQLIESFGDESRKFSKITSSLQRQITRLRLVSIDSVFRRLARPVRDAARQENKVVDLQIEGGDVQLDKAIVEGIHAPLLHLVRNAVSHGIESPGRRRSAGKTTKGTIRITAQPHHNSVMVEVRDDGYGLDYPAILAKARSLGLVEPEANPSREQLQPLIFRPGFSTGQTVTDLAGRGVGMDVVAREIAALNGTLLVDSKDGEGVTVRMMLPVMTSIDEVFLLHTGSQCYALGSDFVEQAISIEAQNLIDVDGQPMVQVRNELIPVMMLGSLVDAPAPTGTGTALLLRAGDRCMALLVDRVEPQREVVIRPLGRVLEAHPFLSGATISGDGAVIFTLHVTRLFDVLAMQSKHPSTYILASQSDEPPADPQAVLVVDDSISVRKLAARFLEVEGIEVDTAIDGLDALKKLASGRFRMVITDLEMPRMHGYELIAEIRRQPALRHLPVIVCSSRSSEKHRQRAFEVGAQGYLTKPFTSELLLAEIQKLTHTGMASPRLDGILTAAGLPETHH